MCNLSVPFTLTVSKHCRNKFYFTPTLATAQKSDTDIGVAFQLLFKKLYFVRLVRRITTIIRGRIV